MTIRSHEAADNSLADALWWLKGFAAALPADDRSTPAALAESLRQIREWLNRLPYGLERLIGLHDSAFGIVLTEHEFEVLWDAVRSPEGSEGADERRKALAQLRPVLDKFNEERKAFAAAKNDEVPF